MEKEVKFTETENGIVAKISEVEIKDYTLAELSEIVGKELKSGNVNGLVKKGVLICTPQNREVEYVARKKVATYRLNK